MSLLEANSGAFPAIHRIQDILRSFPVSHVTLLRMIKCNDGLALPCTRFVQDMYHNLFLESTFPRMIVWTEFDGRLDGRPDGKHKDNPQA